MYSTHDLSIHRSTFSVSIVLCKTGVPFYVNVLSTTLIKCLANPTIAGMLKQYPEEPAGAMQCVFIFLKS